MIVRSRYLGQLPPEAARLNGIKSVNYYPHHIGDYKKETAHLSLLEHGAYRQLLDWYYMDESPIPKETDLVFRRLCARTEQDKAAILIVLEEFFILTDDGWIQDRCDREISAYRAKADRAKENGKLGGRPSKTETVISRNLKETESQANQDPITINHKPITNNQEEGIGAKTPERKRFIPPSLDEVKEYCKERGGLVDPNKWHSYYTSNGWKVGKNSMKDWKAAIRTWESGEKSNQKKAPKPDNFDGKDYGEGGLL